MKYDKEVAAHVIKNIALIESSLKVMRDIEETLFKAIGKFIEKQVKDSDLKLGKDNLFNFFDEHEIYFSTEVWEEGAKDQYATYHLYSHCDEEEPQHLTQVLGESDGAKLNLFFTMGTADLGLRKSAFKNLLRNEFEKHEALHKLGFMLSDEGEAIVLFFHLDKDKVAEEYPHFDECFDPLKQAFDTVFEGHPIFEKIVENIKQQAQASK
jgi:hypothetical protein